MSPKLQALKDALDRMDRAAPWGSHHIEARKEMLKAAYAAGFEPHRAAEDWARYKVAVGEAVDDAEVVLNGEPEPEQEPLL